MKSPTRRSFVRLTPFSMFGLLLAIVGCGTITIDIRTEILSRQEITQNIEYVISGPIATLFITDGEVDLGEESNVADIQALEAAGWVLTTDVKKIDGDDALVMKLSQTFKAEDAAEQFRLASEALAEGDTTTSMIPYLEIAEDEDEIVYSLRMAVSLDEVPEESGSEFPVATIEPLIIDGTPFAGLPDFSDAVPTDELGGAFSDGLGDFTDALTDSFGDFITMNWIVEMPGNVTESNATSEDGGRLTWELDFDQLSEIDSDLFATSVVNKNSGGSCNR